MTGILNAHGLGEMARLATMPTVLLFDLDGTLAPIVPIPADAKVPESTAALMAELSCQWPLGIITGRALQDARTRLGFTPRYLYGNHGAEHTEGASPNAWQSQLDPCRKYLRQIRCLLASRSVWIEDKGLSLALHYSSEFDIPATRLWLDRLMCLADEGIRSSHGHRVMNLTPTDAPDKGDALLKIARDCGAIQVFMIGDDINDESAFAKAPSGSVTVRIGNSQTPTSARFTLPSQLQINRLLATLLVLRNSRSHANPSRCATESGSLLQTSSTMSGSRW